MKIIKKIRMTDCSLDKGTNKLFFIIKLYQCQTKDELDLLEKQKIDEFFALDRGYNSTSGNQ